MLRQATSKATSAASLWLPAVLFILACSEDRVATSSTKDVGNEGDDQTSTTGAEGTLGTASPSIGKAQVDGEATTGASKPEPSVADADGTSEGGASTSAGGGAAASMGTVSPAEGGASGGNDGSDGAAGADGEGGDSSRDASAHVETDSSDGGSALDGGQRSDGGQASSACPEVAVRHGDECTSGTDCVGYDSNVPEDGLTCDCVAGEWACRWTHCPTTCSGVFGCPACPRGDLPDGCTCEPQPPPESQNVGICLCFED